MRICNPVLADCPPIKEEHSMLRQSDKIARPLLPFITR